jgi:hypothetical protein
MASSPAGGGLHPFNGWFNDQLQAVLFDDQAEKL